MIKQKGFSLLELILSMLLLSFFLVLANQFIAASLDSPYGLDRPEKIGLWLQDSSYGHLSVVSDVLELEAGIDQNIFTVPCNNAFSIQCSKVELSRSSRWNFFFYAYSSP